MSTPAAARFERLFANRQRPPKPVLHDKPQAGDDSDQAHVPTTTDTSKASEVAIDHSQAQCHDSFTDTEDDDYVRAFAKKPVTKIRSSNRRLSSGSGATGDSKDTESKQQQQQQPIEFLPLGKPSGTGSHKKGLIDDMGDLNTTSYDGDGHALTGQFCLFNLVAKFPYKYMNDPNDQVSHHFFAGGKFYNRPWLLHYLQTPPSSGKPALVLVPLAEVQKLVDEISVMFQIDMNVPSFPFTLSFYEDGTPRPALLGTSKSREDFTRLKGAIPEPVSDYGQCPTPASKSLTRSYEAYQEKVEKALLASKVKGSTSKTKKSKKAHDFIQESQNQIQRAQRYFGLRPLTRPIETVSDLSWEQDRAYRTTQLKACGLLFDFLDVNEKVPHAFQHEAVVISIDVEWYERNSRLVTEVGLSILDTLDLVDVPPGPGGENWVKHIRSRHFRIKGREHLINKDFCVGNPDSFGFGTSEFLTLDQIAETVDHCFQWPFCVDFKNRCSEDSSQEIDHDNTSDQATALTAQKGAKRRNIVIVGHSIAADLDCLQGLGSRIFSPEPTLASRSDESTVDRRYVLTSILEMLDTATLYMSLRGEAQPRRLGHICLDLGIDAQGLHNAGNDARYTLEAAVRLLVKARVEEDERHRVQAPDQEGVLEDEWQAELMRHVDDRVERARHRIKERVNAQTADPATDLPTTPADGDDSIGSCPPGQGMETLGWRQDEFGMSTEEQMPTWREDPNQVPGGW